MTAAYTTEKDAAFPDGDGAPKIKFRSARRAFRAGEAFEPGGGIGIRELIKFVFGADGEVVPAAGARGRVNVLSIRAFRFDTDNKDLFVTNGTGDRTESLLYDL